MATSHINRVILVGNLTKDPDLRSLPSGLSICRLRVACNSRRKVDDRWETKPNFFDVSVFGAQADSSYKYLSKGRSVAIDGRLDWHEWEEPNGGKKRQSVGIVAENVQFLGGPRVPDTDDASASDPSAQPPQAQEADAASGVADDTSTEPAPDDVAALAAVQEDRELAPIGAAMVEDDGEDLTF